MDYSYLLYFFIAIFLCANSNPIAPSMPLAAALGLGLLSFGCHCLCCRRLFAHPSGDWSYFKAEKKGFVLALATFAFWIHGLRLKYYLRPLNIHDQSPTLADLGCLFFFLLLLAPIWLAARRRSTLIFPRRLSPLAFIWTNLKLHLPLILPWAAISLLFDLTAQLTGWKEKLSGIWGNLFSLFCFFLILLLVFPPMLQRIWNCRPLPPGPLRQRIVAFCHKQNFHAPILIWPLFGGQGLSAAIVGLIPGMRYLMLTPGLINTLEIEELESVLAHEIGHAKHLHLLWHLGMVASLSIIMTLLLEILPAFLLQGDWVPRLSTITNLSPETLLDGLLGLLTLSLLLLYFRFLFGYFLRNFERQADLYVFKAQGGARRLIASFERLALLNEAQRAKSNWHHFGLDERIAFLQRCQVDPGQIRRHSKKIALSLAGYWVSFGLLLGLYLMVDTAALKAAFAPRYTEIMLQHKMRQEPHQSAWPRALGDLLLEQQKEDQAVQMYERALELDPAHPTLNNNFAWLLLTAEAKKLRDPKRALNLASEAVLRAKPLPPTFLDTLAVAYWANGKLNLALRAEALAMSFDPANEAYYSKQQQRFRTQQWSNAP